MVEAARGPERGHPATLLVSIGISQKNTRGRNMSRTKEDNYTQTEERGPLVYAG